jgi:hypothetical protein
MIQNLFSSQIWLCSLNVESHIKNKILNCIEQNFKNNKSYLHPFWSCSVHSTILEHNDDIDYSEIIPYFKNEYEKFALAINLKNHNYTIPIMWYNYYLKGYNQEIHDHISDDGNNIYSAVYFLKLTKDHPLITFYNYTNYHVLYSSKKNIKEIYWNDNINHSITTHQFSLDVEEDSFVIFPSYMPHGVFVQKTDEPRITISMNFALENKNGSSDQ